MSKRIVLFTPPLFLIGDVKEWPPAKGEEFSFDNAAAMMNGVMNTPQGPQQVIQFNWMSNLTFLPRSYTAYRKPEAVEEQAYASFRAARSGISVAGANDLPKHPKLVS